MVMLDQGLNAIRDLLFTSLSKGQLGTDTSQPLASQTDLIAPEAVTKITLSSKSKADKFITAQYVLPSTIGAGTEFKEYALRDSGDVAITRSNFVAVTQTSSQEIVIKTTITFE